MRLAIEPSGICMAIIDSASNRIWEGPIVIAPVVDLDWWKEHRADVVLTDVRWYLDGRSGRQAYESGHLPGAVFVDLDRWLADESSETAGRHPLPTPEVFAAGMSQLGIANNQTVVAYDDAGGVIAARLVWMLRALGQDATLLDGGLQAFDGPLETGALSPTPVVFRPSPWPTDRIADIHDASDRQNLVIDARSRERYEGGYDPIDPRPGHIPGAKNVPCRENLAADGRFLPVAEIRKRFLDAGVESGAAVISYCGSGVTACHNLLALEYVGLGRGRLYPGSWSQYGHALDRPAATGIEL
ncbi:3-mercaptopyruvate sulfurtransferase [mine drainage metagenome]|uniref:3-mercaptopyruvate sulfurtransferase n=1 Tax=mine drainage metagenome TaxID=410659 RepID=A0A1J5Q1E8_9ZZZZ